ncbi:hypothetical protein CQA65_30135, partial [Klebsiella pneumoniae]
MSQSDEPTYEALVESLLALDDGWSDVFGQCCSNPVKNAWGENVDFTALNKGREVASREQSEILLELLKPLWSVDNIVAQCNEMSQSDEP